MDIHIGLKESRQIAEDSWEVYYPMKTFPETATLREVADWIAKYQKGLDKSFVGFIEIPEPVEPT